MTFLLAANPGESPRPLGKAASGGELSRAMLALRVVLSEAPPTLVFDEVDAGIGGEAGAAVGRAARRARRQAPGAVRHAPRAGGGLRRRAGRGEKEQRRRTVGGRRDRCSRGARVSELSRMLAGVGESDARPQPRRGAARGAGETASSRSDGPACSAREAGADGDRGRRRPRRPPHQGPRSSASQPRRGRHHRPRDLDRVAADGLVEAGVGRGGERGASRSRGRYPNGGPDPDRRRPASRWSTTSAPTCMDRVARASDPRRARDERLARRREARDRRAAARRRRDRSRAWRRRGRRSAPSSSASPRTRSSTSSAEARAHVRADRRCRRCTRRFRGRHALVVVRGHDYRTTSPRCARTSASTGRCSSASTAAPTRCSRSASSPTSSSATSTRCRDARCAAAPSSCTTCTPTAARPGREHCGRGASPYEEFVVEGTSEDVAMLLAYEAGAKLIVAVGTHATMVEFLDKGRGAWRRRS